MLMTERRRDERVRIVGPSVGVFRVVQDVDIQRFSGDDVFVIAASPIPRGERLLLESPQAGQADARSLLVRALENRVYVEHGVLRWVVRLALTPRLGESEPQIDGTQLGSAERATSAVVRRVPIRLVEASRSGCRFQSPASIDVGTVGFVELRTSERCHSEALRVNRESRTRERIWPYAMAGDFLTIGPVSLESLRGVATIIAVGDQHQPSAAPAPPVNPNATIS